MIMLLIVLLLFPLQIMSNFVEKYNIEYHAGNEYSGTIHNPEDGKRFEFSIIEEKNSLPTCNIRENQKDGWKRVEILDIKKPFMRSLPFTVTTDKGTFILNKEKSRFITESKKSNRVHMYS